MHWWYEFECKLPNEREKEKVFKVLKRVFKPSLESKAKPSPPQQFVKCKCQIWSKITKKFAKKCLDAWVKK